MKIFRIVLALGFASLLGASYVQAEAKKEGSCSKECGSDKAGCPSEKKAETKEEKKA